MLQLHGHVVAALRHFARRLREPRQGKRKAPRQPVGDERRDGERQAREQDEHELQGAEGLEARGHGALQDGVEVARALALAGREVIVVERHRLPGQETTSRNSSVIHSGIYYPKDSLKAKLCVRGRELLYDFCQARDIAHSRCGKVIVAQEAQVPGLKALEQKGLANGVTDLAWLSAAQVRELEPEVRCAAGLPCNRENPIDRGFIVRYASLFWPQAQELASPVARIFFGTLAKQDVVPAFPNLWDVVEQWVESAIGGGCRIGGSLQQKRRERVTQAGN